MMRVHSLFITLAFAAAGLTGPMLIAQVRGSAMPSSPPMGTQPGVNGTTAQPGMPSQTMDQQRSDDKRFVRDAALSGMTEIEVGKLAAEKGSTDAVKQFGQKLADDHAKANDELKQIAAQEKIEIPESLDAKHQSRVDKLAKLSGPEFDRAFLKDEVKDHQRSVSDFESESRDGADPNVKSFASKTLPTLQAHLSTVKELSSSE